MTSKMELNHEYKYCVVEFLEKPYDDVDKNICVPFSWIKLRRRAGRNVSVAYPAENLLSTKEKVRKKQKYLKEWNFYSAIVKHGTDSFIEAETYIRIRNNNINNEKGCSDIQTPCSDNKRGTKRRACKSKQCNPPEPKVIKTHVKKNPLNRKGPIRLSLKLPTPEMSSGDLHKLLFKTRKTTKSVSDVPNNSTIPLHSPSEKQLLLTDDACSNKEHNDVMLVETPAEVIDIPEKDKNETPSIQNNLSRQVLEQSKLSIVRTNCLDKESQETIHNKGNEFNGNYEMHGALNSLINTIAKRSTDTVNKLDPPSKHTNQGSSFVPYAKYLEKSNICMQEILATSQSLKVKQSNILQLLLENQLIPVGSDYSNIPRDPIIAETSAVVDDISRKPTENKAPSNRKNMSCQLLKHSNDSKLSTIHTNCSDQEPYETVREKNNEFNGNYERFGARNSSTFVNSTALNSTNTVNQFHRPSKYSEQGQSFLPNVHPDLRTQNILAQRSTEVNNFDLSYWTPRNTTNSCAAWNSQNLSSCSFKHSHEYQSSVRYEGFLHPDPRLRNCIDERSCLQSNTNMAPLPTMQNYQNVASVTSQTFEDSRNNQYLTVNGPYLWRDPNEVEIFVGRSMNTNDNQRCFPENSTNSTPSAMQNLMNHYSLSPNHGDRQQSLTINGNYIQQELRTQEQPDKRSTNNNRVDQAFWGIPINTTSPRTHNVHGTPAGGSNDANCIDQRALTHSTAISGLDVLNGWVLPDPVKRIVKRVSKEKHMNSKGCHPNTTNNTPSAVRNFSSSSNQSCCSSNCSNRKQISPVVKNNLYQDPRKQEKHAGGSYDAHSRNQSVCLLNNVPGISEGWVLNDPVKRIENPIDSRACLPNIEINGFFKIPQPQSIPQNIPSAVQSSSSSSNHSYNNLNKKQVSYLVQDHFYKDSGMQETLAKRSTEAHSTKESVFARNDIEKRPSVIQNSSNINQSFEHMIQDREKSLDKEMYTEEKRAERNGNVIHSTQSTRPEIRKDNKLMDIQNMVKQLDGRAIAELAVSKEMRDIFDRMKLVNSNSKLYSEQTTFDEIYKLSQKFMDITYKFCKAKNNNDIAST